VSTQRPIAYFVRALPDARVECLGGILDVRGGRERPATREQLLAEAADATVLAITYLDRVDRDLLRGLPRLRHLASYGVGVNHIDLEACSGRDILVTNTPGVLTEATADMAMALLLAAARRVAEADRRIRAGGWVEVNPAWMLGTQVTGKTLGLVGFGRIGQAVARRAAGFQMQILYANPCQVDFAGARRVSLESLLRDSDFVSLHVPLTHETENLLSRRRIAGMKRGAVLVNTARGDVVDDAALAEALASGHLGAAGLDTFRAEPRVPDAFLRLPNIVLTPHLGSGTRETRGAMSAMVLDEIMRVARGWPPLFRVA
jgi:glyoxylate reductase